LYDNAHAFPKTGDYTITIQQGMRMEQLRGITDIGVKILKNY
jgi:gliding motility-associated lipoprotein GldH